MTWSQMRDAAKQQGFEPLPIGTYNMRAEQIKIVPGKVGQQFQIRLVVTDGPIAGRGTINRLAPFKNDGDVNGMFFQQLAALGLPDTDPIWQQIDQVGLEQGMPLIAQRIDGAMSVVDIDHQNWNGELRDNVKKMRPYQGVPTAGGPGMVPMVPGQNMPYGAPVPGMAPVPQAPAQAPYSPAAPAQVTYAPVAPAPPMPQPVPAPEATAPVPPAPAPAAPVPYQPEQPPAAPGGVQPTAPVANPSI